MINKFDITSAPLKGETVIEASAGTGKTYAIAGLFLRLIVEGNLKVNQILVVTFTVAATDELRDRIRRRLREGLNALIDGYQGSDAVLAWLAGKYKNNITIRNRLKEAIICFDEAAIFTIHGFCQKLLSENAFESSTLFDTELLLDDSDILIEVCRDYYRRHFLNMYPLLFSNPQIKQITPDSLLKLIKCLSIDPDFIIIPKITDICDNPNGSQTAIKSAVEELETLFSSIRQMWINQGKAISNLILKAQDNKAFNGTYIKKTTYITAIAEMDTYVKNGNLWDIVKPSKIVKDDKIEKTISIEKLTNSFMQEKAKDSSKLPAHPIFQYIDDFINLLDKTQHRINKFCLCLKLYFLKSAKDSMKKSKMAKNVRAFDDLLAAMHNAVGDGSTAMARAVRNRFSAALIDEFQDTDPLQYSIFTNIFKGDNTLLYLIGDPKQAIYGFRGADIYAYLKAKKSVDSSYTLETNWRSDGGLVTAVNSIFDLKVKNPFVIDGIDFSPVSHAPDREQGSLYIYINRNPVIPMNVELIPVTPMNIAFIGSNLSSSEEESSKKEAAGFITKGDAETFAAKYTASKISEMINKGSYRKTVIIKDKKAAEKPVIIDDKKSAEKALITDAKDLSPEDIAVLVRTNRQTLIVLEELRKLSIPAVIYSAGSVYAEEEAMEIERFMRAAAEPSNERNLKAALITSFFGFNSSQIFELAVDEKRYDSLQNEFLEYNRLWRKSGFISMFRYMIGKRRVRQRVLKYKSGERKLTNYLHIAELLHIADIELKPGIDRLINFLAKRRLAVDKDEKTSSNEYRLRLETDEKAVKIITVHRSKGLEFPVVFCPYLYYSRDSSRDDILKFHDNNGTQTLDIGSDDFHKNRQKMHKEEFAESIRLAYVALTRARYACFTIWGRINKSENSALAWLFHNSSIQNAIESTTSDCAGFKNYDWENMRSDINIIADNSNNTISVEVISNTNIEPQIYLSPLHNKLGLSCKKFKEQEQGRVPEGWRISSFSSIFAGRDSQLPDHDEIDSLPFLIEYLPVEKNQSEGKFFDFPRGARAGSCIHEIMENIDFTQPDVDIARERLKKFGFNEDDEIDKIKEMFDHVLKANLKDSLSLEQIKNGQRINEMEFFFPVGNTNSTAIAEVMKKYGNPTISDFASTMKSLGFSQKGGYLKGFIDMIFCDNEKFYIVDWKTNYLGNSFEHYEISILNKEMKRSGYVLQYLLYTLALDLYLKQRVKDYTYDKHFGGVFYLFMRGIKQGSDTGIYFDRPDSDMVEQLKKELSTLPAISLNSRISYLEGAAIQ